ncbi:hypothetical protein Q3G72_009989 [Acer saccharum]|nr:hypothetical protein Q3G72_009989 [Acer saccharum]
MSYYDLSYPKADMQVFNHHNHNAADIVTANEPISDKRYLPDLFLWVLENYKVKRGQQMIVSKNDNIGKGNTVKSKSKGVEDEGNRMSSKSNNGKGENISIAKLMKKTGRNELLAVVFHLGGSFATRVLDTRGLFKLMRLRQLFITCAVMAMIGAFLSGTFAVLHSDRNLAISATLYYVTT